MRRRRRKRTLRVRGEKHRFERAREILGRAARENTRLDATRARSDDGRSGRIAHGIEKAGGEIRK